jgi:nitroreductase
MVRAYDPGRPVDRPTLLGLLDLATRAPSAGFTQGWDFVLLDTAEQRDRFWTAGVDPAVPPDTWLTGMRTAPVLVVCCSDPRRYLDRYAEPDKGWYDRSLDRWPVPYWDVDTGMAAIVLLLSAVDAGLAGCFFGVPVERLGQVREALGVPDDRNLVGVVALGHPAPDRRSPSLRRGRRPLADVVHLGRFGEGSPPWPPLD